MYNHLATKLNAAATISSVRWTISGLLAEYAAQRLGRKCQAIHESLNARARYDIGCDDVTGPSTSLAAGNPHVLAVSLQRLLLP